MSKKISPELFHHPFIKSLRTTIFQNKLLEEREAVIIALSGGADSLSLLIGLQKLGYTCSALHCNFHLRGEESDRDEIFCKNLCDRLQIPLKVVQCNTYNYAKEGNISLEMAARELRYNAFQVFSKEINVKKIATAHHLKDNLETLILHLSQGSGISGLRGIPISRENIIRPLLNTEPQFIYSFLKLLDEDFCIDSTNQQIDINRNYIRHKIIPLLENLNPSLLHSSERLFYNLRETEILYKKAIKDCIENARTFQPYSCFKEVDSFSCEKIEQSQATLSILYSITEQCNFNRADLESFSLNILKKESAFLESKSHILVRSFGALHLIRQDLINKPLSIFEYQIKDWGNTFSSPFGRFEYKITHTLPSSFDKNKIYIDISDITVEEGDFISLKIQNHNADVFINTFGTKNSKKRISILLKENKIPLQLRDNVPVLYMENKPIAILQMNRSNYRNINKNTKKILIFNPSPELL